MPTSTIQPGASVPFITAIRDTLFGDRPLEAWPPQKSSASGEPWDSFIRARDALAAGRTAEAFTAWQSVVATPGLESRHYLQAWHFLRSRGVQPDTAAAKHLLGVVFEVPMDDGLDLLAAYADGTARYYNFSGAGVVWERPNDTLDTFTVNLLQAGQQILRAIGPWDKPRPPAPPKGQVRINLLSAAGLHFGQGQFAALRADPFAAPTIEAATNLMIQLTRLADQQKR